MQTSYFANLKHIRNPLSISRKSPSWYTGPQCKALAPKYEFLNAYKNGEINESEYVKEYFSQVLNHLSAGDMYKFLMKTYGDDVILLCYEKPGEFCHRRIVSYWFEQSLGVEVPEFILSFTPHVLIQF